MEVIENQKGGQKLCYQGFMYKKRYVYRRVNKNNILWECCQHRSFACNGTVTTNENINALCSSTPHSHDPDHDIIEAAKAKMKMKKLAVENKEKTAQEIIAEVMACQSPEAQAVIGEETAAIKQLILRCKRKQGYQGRGRELQTNVVPSTFDSDSVPVDIFVKQEDVSLSGELTEFEANDMSNSSFNNESRGATPKCLASPFRDVGVSEVVHNGTSRVANQTIVSYNATDSMKVSSNLTSATPSSACRAEHYTMNVELKLSAADQNSENISPNKYPVWKPTEKYERAKQLCKSLALLASQVPDDVFIIRFAVLEKLHSEWTTSWNSSAVDKSRVINNFQTLVIGRNVMTKIKNVLPTDLEKTKKKSQTTAVAPIYIEECESLKTEPTFRPEAEPGIISDSIVQNYPDDDGLDSDNDVGDNDHNDGDGSGIEGDSKQINDNDGIVNDDHPTETLNKTTAISKSAFTKEDQIYTCNVCKERFKNEHALQFHMRKHKVFKCQQCNRRFKSFAHLHQHERAHVTTLNPDGTKRRLQCSICSRTLRDKYTLESHMRCHGNEKPCICQVCGKAFRERKRLLQHLRAHTQEHRYKCDMCEKTYLQPAGLQRHMIRHACAKPYACDICDKKYADNSTLILHRQKVHSGPTGTDVKSFSQTRFRSPRKPKQQSTKRYPCSICSKPLRSCAKLNDHMNQHTNTRPYQCDRCPKAYFDSRSLEKHLFTHTGRLDCVCTVCGSAFPHPWNLRLHMRQHSDVRPFQCAQCPMGFNNQTRLKVHERVHSGEKPFHCEECGKTFHDPSLLVRHAQIHSDRRPHVCATCGMSYKNSFALKCHIRSHSGDRPYLCKLCPSKFMRSNTLKKHMRCMHTCPVCKEHMPSDKLQGHKAGHGCSIIHDIDMAAEKVN